jgi:hypothetical protein
MFSGKMVLIMAESHHHQHHTHHSRAPKEPHYWVMAEVCEPKYAKEIKFLETELAFVRRKLAEHGTRISMPSFGFYGHQDWRKYEHKLQHYADQLGQYAEDIQHGVLPIRFLVYNSAELKDTGIHVSVKVKGGRVDEGKKAPERPERIDGPGKGLPKFLLPRLGFSRTGIKVTPHSVSAVLSDLGSKDGAALMNQVVHVHLGEHTEVTYEVMSHHVSHETGHVEIVEE